MKAYKVEIYGVNFDDMSEEDIAAVIENVRYPNHCLYPHVAKVTLVDVGEWHDDHPLNNSEKYTEKMREIFK